MASEATLPEDILCAIFCHTLPDLANVWSSKLQNRPYSPYELPFSLQDYLTPIAISQVCNRWHEISVALPALWSFIVVDDIRGLSDEAGFVTIRLSTWIERSGSYPLTILFISSPESYFSQAFGCLEAIFAVSHRWKHMFLCLDWGMKSRTEEAVVTFAEEIAEYTPPRRLPHPSSSSMPTLQDVFTEMIGHWSIYGSEEMMSRVFDPICSHLDTVIGKSAGLRRAYLFTERNSRDWAFALRRDRTPVFHSLNTIQISTVTLKTALILLSSCPVLQSVALDIPQDDDDDDDDDQDEERQEESGDDVDDQDEEQQEDSSDESEAEKEVAIDIAEISLPHLTYFDLTILSMKSFSIFLNAITAPSLTRFNLSFSESHLSEDAQSMRDSCAAFLSRSQCKLAELTLFFCQRSTRVEPPFELPFPISHDSCVTVTSLSITGATINHVQQLLSSIPDDNMIEVLTVDPYYLHRNEVITPFYGSPTFFPRLRTIDYKTTFLPEELGALLDHIEAPLLQSLSIEYDWYYTYHEEDHPPWPMSQFSSFVSRCCDSITHLQLLFRPDVAEFDLLDILRLPQLNATLQHLAVWTEQRPVVTDALVESLTIREFTNDEVSFLPALRFLLLVDTFSCKVGALPDMLLSRLKYAKLEQCIVGLATTPSTLHAVDERALLSMESDFPGMVILALDGRSVWDRYRAG